MRTRFDEIAGLRIYLALWVAVGHGLQTAGFVRPTNKLMDLILSGDAAVAVFIIISGFVITHLVETAREPYGRYIVRRAFRLYPVYLLACIAGFSVADSWAELAAMSPWHNVAGWPEYSGNIASAAAELHDNTAAHIIAHLFLAHGLVPNELLPFAARTILPAAWSISLEWQFYLVAPFVLFALRTRAGLLWTVVASLMVFFATKMGFFGSHDFRSFIGSAIPFFAVGIASRLFAAKLAKVDCHPVSAAVLAVGMLLMIGKEVLPLAIWAVFYCFLIWQKDDFLSRAFKVFTASKPAVLLGEASYSFYLIHRPIQVVVATAAISTIGKTQTGMFAAELMAIAVALGLSVALYFGVERPFIKIGKHVTGGKSRVSTVDAVAVAP
jgi:peptidoglycan/LPS O-acetylase OafA/YrhL